MSSAQPSARALGRAVDVLEAARWRSSTFATQQAKAGIDSATSETEARALEDVIIWLNSLGADPDAKPSPHELSPPGRGRTPSARAHRARKSREGVSSSQRARAQGTPGRS